jgi:hypothetical protein
LAQVDDGVPDGDLVDPPPVRKRLLDDTRRGIEGVEDVQRNLLGVRAVGGLVGQPNNR